MRVSLKSTRVRLLLCCWVLWCLAALSLDRWGLGGDCLAECETSLLSEGLDPVDLYKVHHHGSDSSSTEDLLEALSPAAALLSVGPNTYGHPDAGTLERIDAAGASLWRTDDDGDIEVVTDGVTVTVNGVGL